MAYNNTYARKDDGWCYVASGEPVPGAIDLPDGDMWAPEVAWEALVESTDAAALLGIRPNTLQSYLCRGRAPEPQVRLGRTYAWSRQVLMAWHDARPGQGRHVAR